MNNSITAFLKELRQAFPMLSKKEKQFYKDISNSVWVFAEQNPGCTKEDLFEYFGEPKKIASVYYSNMDSVTFYTKLNKANRVNWMLLACVVFLAAIAILVLYLCYTASVAAHKGTAGINIIQASNHNYIILEFTPTKTQKKKRELFLFKSIKPIFLGSAVITNSAEITANDDAAFLVVKAVGS